MRLVSKWHFPSYAHRPGVTPHPNKLGGHSYNKQEPLINNFDFSNLRASEEFLFACDLFNYKYYWEAHVYWEAIWHYLGRKGREADLIKSLIKLSASLLKAELGDHSSAKAHFERYTELSQGQAYWVFMDDKLSLT